VITERFVVPLACWLINESLYLSLACVEDNRPSEVVDVQLPGLLGLQLREARNLPVQSGKYATAAALVNEYPKAFSQG